MALFTGRYGSAEISRAEYAAGLKQKDALNLRRATKRIAADRVPDDLGILNPQGVISPQVQAGLAPPKAAGTAVVVRKPVKGRVKAPVKEPTKELEVSAASGSQVGLRQTPGIQQIDLEGAYPSVVLQRWQAGSDMDRRMRTLRMKIIPVPGRANDGSLTHIQNLAATGLNEAARGLEYYVGANKSRRDEMDRQEAMHKWYGGDMGGGPGSKMIYANPALLAEAEADLGKFYDKYSKKTGAKAKGKGKGKAEAKAAVKGGEVLTEAQARKEVQKQVGVDDVPKGNVLNALTQLKPKAPRRKVNVQLGNEELLLAVAKRKILFDVADAYKRAGMGAQYIQAVGMLDIMTATVNSLAQQKAINLFENSGDPRMLQAMWGEKIKQKIDIVPRSDGKWDIWVAGKQAFTGQSTGEIVFPSRSSVSLAYTNAVNAAAAKRNAERESAGWKQEGELTIATLQEMWKYAGIEQKEWMKAKYGMTPDASGAGMWAVVGGKRVLLTSGKTMGPDGEGDADGNPIPKVHVMKGGPLLGGGAPMNDINDAAKALYK